MIALIVLLLIVLNGLFAMAEIAVVSSNKFRLEQRARAGSTAARRALALAENPNRFLSTVQVGITLVGVLSGAFGGAALSGPLAGQLARVSWLAPFAEPLALALVVVAITYLSLIIGELVPKRIALGNPERIAMALAGFMGGLSVIASPLVWLLSVSTEGLLRLLGVRPQADDEISEEDIDMVIAQGRRAGVIEPAEQEIIENAFWLGERRVNAIMTPRHEVRWLDAAATKEEILEAVRAEPHGRYLVGDGSLDRLEGYAASSDLLAVSLTGREPDLRSLVRKPLVVPETLPILKLLERFRASGTHLAVVYDEYGGFEGLVTLSDILEELVGEVPSYEAGEELEARSVGAGAWEVSGALHVDDLLKLIALDDQVDLSDAPFQTVGGLAAARLGRVPETGDSFTWRGFDLMVLKMEGLRVERVRVVRNGVQSDEPEPGGPQPSGTDR